MMILFFITALEFSLVDMSIQNRECENHIFWVRKRERQSEFTILFFLALPLFSETKE